MTDIQGDFSIPFLGHNVCVFLAFELLIYTVLYADVSYCLIVLFCPADVTVDLRIPCRCQLQVALLRPSLSDDRRVQVRTSPLGGIEIQYQMGGAASLGTEVERRNCFRRLRIDQVG